MMKQAHTPIGIAALTYKISRPLSRDKSDTLLLLSACLLVLAPHAGHLPLWVTVCCALALSWRGWITFSGVRMPPNWILVPIAALTMLGVLLTYKTLLGRDAGVAMLVLLIAFKLLEMRAKRDLFAVVFVSFFIILTNFFYSQSIATALMMIAAVIALLTTQLSFQYTDVVPPLRKRLALGAQIFGLAVPLTLVLFILFPRIQGPLWGLPSDAAGGRTGLSDTMAPGNISNLAQSNDIAFRVKFIDTMPAQSKLYWRGVVLGSYDGRTWSQLHARARGRSSNYSILIRPRSAAIRHQVTLEPSGRPWLFALELPQAAPQLPGNASVISQDLQLISRHPITERVRYDVASIIDFDLQPNETNVNLQDSLALPPDYNPNTLAFAASLRKQSPDDLQLVNAVLNFFHQEKFSYTLQPPLLGRNAVDEFLFSTRAGFCEHYASAFVIIMRAAGIPARVVTGYQGGEFNSVDGFLTVRQSDAHAWAEVWLKNRGWVRIDPTAAVAPDRIEKNLSSIIPRTAFGGLITLNFGPNSWLSSLRLNLDAINNAWNQRVLNYNQENQRNFIHSLGFDDVDWRTLTMLTLVLGSTVVAIGVLPLLIQRRKTDPVKAIYAALCNDMTKRGMSRARHEGPRDYRLRLTDANSPLAPEKKSAVARFLSFYEFVQYGATSKTSRSVIVFQLKSLLNKCR